MTRSVYTLCGFEKNKPVGFCVVCEICGNHKQRNYKQRNINKEAVYKGTTSTRGTHRATALYSDKAVESLQVAVADKVLSATLSATLQLAEHQLVTKIFGSRLQMADKNEKTFSYSIPLVITGVRSVCVCVCIVPDTVS